jgi:tetratricopeptide (TPR) repeat protein
MQNIKLIFMLLFISCQNSKNTLEYHKKSLQKPTKVTALQAELSPYAQTRITRLLRESENNNFSEALADEALLIGKTVEDKKDYESARKLYTICFQYNQNIIAGLSLTQMLLMLKEYNDAHDVAMKLTVLYPKRPEPELILSHIYQLQGNLEAYEKRLKSSYKKHPNNEFIVINYASHMKLNSKKILKKFLIRNPKSTNVMLQLAQNYYQEKNLKNSLKYAKKAFHIDPDNVELITLIAKIEQEEKNYENAEKFFKLAFEKELDNNIHAQNYINNLISQKKYQEALAILLKLESSSDEQVPFPAEFSFQIIKIMIFNEDYQEAQERLKQLEKSNYNPSFTNYYLALCYEKTFYFEKALEYIEKIPQESEMYQEAQKEKILIYINAKRKKEAEEELAKFKISENNKVEDTLFQITLLSYFSKYHEALQILNLAIQKHPKEKRFYLKKAEYLKYTKSPKDSLIFAEKIKKKWPKYPEGLNFLGYSLIENRQNLSYARKILHKAVSLDPQNGFYLDSLGWAYFQKNDFKKAVQYLTEAVSYEQDEPVILYHLAMTQIKLKQFEKALTHLKMIDKILSTMLLFYVESDPELLEISKKIKAQILKVKKEL